MKNLPRKLNLKNITEKEFYQKMVETAQKYDPKARPKPIPYSAGDIPDDYKK